MKKTKKKSPSQILGLTRIKLTSRSCKLRAKELRMGVESGKFKGAKAELARRWANWYASKANQLAA